MPLSSLAQEFVAASQADCDRRRRYTIVGLIAALIVTTGFSILASWEILKLNAQRHANQAREDLKTQISQSSLIEGTQEFSIEKVAVNKNSVWMAVSTGDQGLLRYDIQNKSIQQYLKGDNITAIWLEEREIWVGVEGKGLLYANLQYSEKNSEINLENINNIKEQILSLAKDANETLWMGTNDGVFYQQKSKTMMQKQKELFRCRNIRRYPMNAANQIALTTQQNIVWIASSYGLLRWQIGDGGEELKCYEKKDQSPNGSGFPVNGLKAVAFNPQNSFLAVSDYEGKVFILKKGAMTPAGEDDSWNRYPDFTNGNQVRRLIMLRERFLIAVISESYMSIYDYSDNLQMSVNLKQDNIEKIHDAFLAPDKILWIGTDRGLYKSRL